jgi:hypothetical protein
VGRSGSTDARGGRSGPKADLPKSLLPKDIDKAVRSLGDDGDRVRITLEREFVKYLDERSKVRRAGDTSELVTTVASNVLKPLSARFGKQLTERLFSPDSAGFDQAMAKVRARYASMADRVEGAAGPDAAAAGEPIAGAGASPAGPPAGPPAGSPAGS